MQNDQWKAFFVACRDVLGQGDSRSQFSKSWCVWTTFSALKHGGHYWTCGIPDYTDISDVYIKDGGLWRQSFLYEDIAHIIVPKTFYWETDGDPKFQNGTKAQEISDLSERLNKEGISHRLTDLVLEIKLY
jgi:hypothetical protein